MHDTILRLADVWKTCNKIRAAVFRVGLNLWDWYRPLDPGGNTLISESKFVSVLAGPLRPVIGLSDDEIAQLADYFRAQDGRVLYHQLCQLIHGEDAGSGGQKSPECQLEACEPPAPPACHSLDPWQARRLCCLLATIAERQLPLKPYFQDYELVAKNDGSVTFAHFARILSFVGVLLSAEDFQLLVRRFIKNSYTVDYVQFLEALEAVKNEGIRGLGPEYMNPAAVINTRDLPAAETGRQPVKAGRQPSANIPHTALKLPPPQRSLHELMQRVQKFVAERRIRMSEFFRDYDPLNHGVVSRAQFLRGLSVAGLTGTVITAAEAACLARQYQHPADTGVCWRTFDDDCDLPITTKELEKYPTLVPGVGMMSVPEVGEPAIASEDTEAALLYLKSACRERGLDLRPVFRDHDRQRSGHVSSAEARRALARLSALPRSSLLRAIERRFTDDKGFCYNDLLDQLEENKAEEKIAPKAACRSTAAHADPRETDIVQIVAKIRGKVVRDGVRPLEFLQQFDKRREQVIPRADFYRALASAGLALSPMEMDTLMEVFSAPGRRRLVDYARFAESACGRVPAGLERAPMLEPVAPLAPAQAAASDPLTFEERQRTASALDALSRYPDQVSNILDVFKEMDRSRRGCIPPRDLERALSRRGLLQHLPPHQLAALCRAFRPRRAAAADEVDYRALCNALDIVHAAARAQPC